MNNEDDDWQPSFWFGLWLRWQHFKLSWLPYRACEMIDDADDLKFGPMRWHWNLFTRKRESGK